MGGKDHAHNHDTAKATYLAAGANLGNTYFTKTLQGAAGRRRMSQVNAGHVKQEAMLAMALKERDKRLNAQGITKDHKDHGPTNSKVVSDEHTQGHVPHVTKNGHPMPKVIARRASFGDHHGTTPKFVGAPVTNSATPATITVSGQPGSPAFNPNNPFGIP